MFPFSRKPITISFDQVSVVTTILMLVALYWMYQVRSVLIMVFLAFIIMVALNPMVKRFMASNRKLPRTGAIVMTYVVLLLVLGVSSSFIFPPLVYELNNLIQFLTQIPWLQTQMGTLSLDVLELQTLVSNLGANWTDVQRVISTLQAPFSLILSLITSTFNNIILVVSLFVMSFFMLMERPHLAEKLSWFTRSRETIDKAGLFLDALEEQLGGWVRGELILMLVIGSLTFIALALIGVPYALPLAILAGLLEIIPNIGPTIAAIPAILIAFLVNGPVAGTVVLGSSILIQQLENNIIVPKIMRDAAHVNPLVSLVAILVGVNTAGIIGALIAVPIYIMARCFYSYYLYDKRPD